MSVMNLDDINVQLFELMEYILEGKLEESIPLASRAKGGQSEHDKLYNQVKNDPTMLRATAIDVVNNTFAMAKELELPLQAITYHLNEMNELKDYHGILYFMVLLTHTVGYHKMPVQFRMFCVDAMKVRRLAGEMLMEWMDLYEDEVDMDEN